MGSQISNWTPQSQAQKDAIRNQLQLLLNHLFFKNSPRSSKLLHYIVERSLNSDGENKPIKERTLGIDVFGRPPDYDTDEDTVVRGAASDVRRRIAQYYHEPGHEGEIQIDLLPGSYIPTFHTSILTTSDSEIASPQVNLFWKVIVDSAAPILLCIGEWPLDVTRMTLVDKDMVARLAAFLVLNGRTFHLKACSSVTSDDIQLGSTILVGGFPNRWTCSAMESLRFRFGGTPGVDSIWIEDRKNPSGRQWCRASGVPSPVISRDYAVFARYRELKTGHWVVLAAGLGALGTSVVGEILMSESSMEEWNKQAPSEWHFLNFEAVIAFDIVNGKAEAPQLQAIELW
jgi:hypothetical protein